MKSLRSLPLFLAFSLCAALAPAALGAETCPNEQLRAENNSTNLPDCRAYELVNPPGLDVGDIIRVPVVSNDGTHIVYLSLTVPDGANGGFTGSSELAHRTPSGWVSLDANPAAPRAQRELAVGVPVAISSDFSQVILDEKAPLDERDWDGTTTDQYRLTVGTGAFTWLTYGENALPDSSSAAIMKFIGASADLSRVVFGVPDFDSLIPGFTQEAGLYLRSPHGLELVSILPDGTAVRGTGVASGVGSPPVHGGNHAVSDDGMRVFFSAPAGPTGGPGGLYERDYHATPEPVTVPVTASQRTGDGGNPNQPNSFIGATHDGSIAYFSSSSQLTDTATIGGGIYRFELATRSLEQVGPAAEGIVMSDDTSHIYFSSRQALSAGAVPGATNLYVTSDLASGGQTRFVAALPTGGAFVRVSRDGRYAIFTSSDSVGGANSNGQPALYEYDDVAGTLACASCRPGGGASHGEAFLGSQPKAVVSPDYQVWRNIADDGRLFFMSTDRIVPADQSFSQDVYEYDHGTTSLISSGRGDDISYYADSSDDGRDVYFTTGAALLPQDKDARELDLYNARIDGGFPVPVEDHTAPCSGDGCQGAAPGVPAVFQGAGSASFSGSGNAPVPDAHPSVTSKATRAQKLTSALKACKKKRPRKVRKRCEAQARKRFGAHKAASKAGGSK
jgi:hypothetical protein